MMVHFLVRARNSQAQRGLTGLTVHPVRSPLPPHGRVCQRRYGLPHLPAGAAAELARGAVPDVFPAIRATQHRSLAWRVDDLHERDENVIAVRARSQEGYAAGL